MATTTGRRSGVRRQDSALGDQAREVARDQVEELARQGARGILMAAHPCNQVELPEKVNPAKTTAKKTKTQAA